MNILIIGSGGREHTFAWKIASSPRCTSLFVAPGNAGTAKIATNIPISVSDFAAIEEAVITHSIDLVVVGPEEPLVKGIVDYFKSTPRLQDILIVGPDASGARLEGSKDFSKDFMVKYGIPTAASATFTASTLEAGLDYLDTYSGPYVLKADGLAAGKGVIITESRDEAKAQLTEMLLDKKFGQASEKVLIEQFLTGIELSVFVLTDGKNYLILPEAKDYKRIGEGDTGLNTGGMGAVSPVPFAGEEFIKKVEERVVLPTLKGLNEEGIHYVGFIFIGLMNTDGEPQVIEYNVRMGDPETEVVLPRIETDLLTILEAAAKGELDKITLTINPNTAVTTVVVAGGYPEEYQKGDEISFANSEEENILVFHAGTTLQEDGRIKTNGGRVLACTALGDTLAKAVEKSQKTADSIKFDGKYFRKDIGKDLMEF